MRELFCLFLQSLNNLLSVLSAFPAVFEVLADAHRPSTSGSEVEETITSREGYFPPECIMVRTLTTSHSSLVRLSMPRRRPDPPLPLYQRIRVLSWCEEWICSAVKFFPSSLPFPLPFCAFYSLVLLSSTVTLDWQLLNLTFIFRISQALGTWHLDRVWGRSGQKTSPSENKACGQHWH